jgi:YfiH family protein
VNVLRSSSLSGLRGVAHGFFGRKGGVSGGIYTSLNCGLGSRDDPQNVIENRTRVAKHLGTVEPNVLTVYQIHSPTAVHVTSAWTRGQGPQADAMATTERGIALGVLAADCAPVLLADEQAGVVGSAHAGWKGAIGGVVESVVELMETLGAKRANIAAAIGPCISQRSYEVGPEFRERFVAQARSNERYFVHSEKAEHWMFDLPGYVAMRSRDAGIGHVDVTGVCTYDNGEDYFSFRRTTHLGEGDYGRQLSAIMLR